MKRVVHFEIAADDPGRAADFYAEVFGWKSHKWDGPVDYWLVATGEGAGIDGGIVPRDADLPAALRGVVNTVEVASVDEAVARAERAGGGVIAPKRHLAGVGWIAYLRDTEGNPFGVMQALAGADEGAAGGGGPAATIL